ncbi:MAG: ABC transporter permease [Bacteroidales bacterium]|nr:ABC transporter permease [Bacteroidales bacterium]
MIKHYLVSTFRLFMKNKTMFFINLIGLSIGFACTFIILSYVLKQNSYDKFHEKKDRIYRVVNHKKSYENKTVYTPYIMGNQLKNNFPEVEAVAQIHTHNKVKIKVDNEFIMIPETYFTSNGFFDIFSTKTIFGNTDNSLTEIHSVVLTKSICEKYFGSENPVGEFIEFKVDNEIYSLKVTAVIDDFPNESSLSFAALISKELFISHKIASHENFKPMRTAWTATWFNTYFTLAASDKIDLLTQKWNKLEESESFPKKTSHFYFQALLDMHFHSDGISGSKNRGNITHLLLFSGIGFLILFIVSINYIILSMASSESRLKEIGLKKTVGSHSGSIRKQQLVESFSISLIGFIIAIVLINLSIDKINLLFNTQIEIDLFGNWQQLGAFLLITILISVISSGYISFFLARKSPIELLSKNTSSIKGKNILQYSLTVFQILIFTILIAGSYSIFSQISYLKEKNPGFETENRVHITDGGASFSASKLINFKANLLQSSEIEEVASGVCLPPTDWKMVSHIPIKDDPENKVIVDVIHASGNYLSLMGIKLVQGRYLDDRMATDSQSCVINKKTANMLNFENPLDETVRGRNVVGVVEDFHTFSLLNENNPAQIVLNKPTYIHHFVLKTTDKGEEKAMAFAKDVWKKYFPDNQPEIFHVEDKINSSFRDDDRLNHIILFFCVISIVLAAIGLYGQSLFSISKKRKEIGIRKVNGATSYKIVLLFLRKYGILTVLANIISWPIVIYFLEKWQSNFVYREDLTFKVLILSFVLSMLIVLLTVFKNSLKSSNTNPIDVLKYE